MVPDDAVRAISAFCAAPERRGLLRACRRFRAACPPSVLVFRTPCPSLPLPASAAERWRGAERVELGVVDHLDLVPHLAAVCSQATVISIGVEELAPAVAAAWGARLLRIDGLGRKDVLEAESYARRCPDLEELEFSGDPAAAVALLPNLTSLSLCPSEPSAASLLPLSNLQRLRSLFVSAAPVPAVVAVLPHLPRLTRFAHPPGNEECVAAVLRHCPGLTHLSANTASAEAALLAAARLPPLTSLSLFDSELRRLRAVLRRLPHITELSMHRVGCAATDEDDAAVGPPLPHLRVVKLLVLTPAEGVAARLLTPLLTPTARLELTTTFVVPGPLPHLRYLLVFGELLTREALLGNCRHWPNLTSIIVGLSDEFDDVVVRAVAAACPRLREVSVDSQRATDAALLALAAGCPELEAARFGRCPGLTVAGVRALVDGCPLLRQVDLTRCEGIGPEEAAALLGRCPRIDEADLRRFCFPDEGESD